MHRNTRLSERDHTAIRVHPPVLSVVCNRQASEQEEEDKSVMKRTTALLVLDVSIVILLPHPPVYSCVTPWGTRAGHFPHRRSWLVWVLLWGLFCCGKRVAARQLRWYVRRPSVEQCRVLAPKITSEPMTIQPWRIVSQFVSYWIEEALETRSYQNQCVLVYFTIEGSHFLDFKLINNIYLRRMRSIPI